MNAPACGLNDAPVEFRKTLNRYLLQSADSLKLVGLRFEVSTLGPCLYVVYNTEEEAAGGRFPRTSMIYWVAGLQVSLIAPDTT